MKGFTLIETVIYIALLGFIMTGALITSYDLIGSTQLSSGKTAVQEEGIFVTRKVAWALSDMSVAPAVGGSGCNQTLRVNKTGYGNNPIEFQRNGAGKSVEMREGGTGAYVPITTGNVSLTCLTFTSLAAAGSAPPGVSVDATLSGLDFKYTKYVHK